MKKKTIWAVLIILAGLILANMILGNMAGCIPELYSQPSMCRVYGVVYTYSDTGVVLVENYKIKVNEVKVSGALFEQYKGRTYKTSAAGYFAVYMPQGAQVRFDAGFYNLDGSAYVTIPSADSVDLATLQAETTAPLTSAYRDNPVTFTTTDSITSGLVFYGQPIRFDTELDSIQGWVNSGSCDINVQFRPMSDFTSDVADSLLATVLGIDSTPINSTSTLNVSEITAERIPVLTITNVSGTPTHLWVGLFGKLSNQ